MFPDRTLIDMARRRPRTKEEFAEVNGVGAAKLEQFAAPFLAAIDGARPDAGSARGLAERGRWVGVVLRDPYWPCREGDKHANADRGRQGCDRG